MSLQDARDALVEAGPELGWGESIYRTGKNRSDRVRGIVGIHNAVEHLITCCAAILDHLEAQPDLAGLHVLGHPDRSPQAWQPPDPGATVQRGTATGTADLAPSGPELADDIDTARQFLKLGERFKMTDWQAGVLTEAWKARKHDPPTVLPPPDVYDGEQVRRIIRAVFGMMWGAEVSDYSLGWFDKRLRDKGLSPADRDLVRSILQGDPE